MSDTLPPLPETEYTLFYEDQGDEDHGDEGYQSVIDEPAYTAAQMREYALAARQQAQVPDDASRLLREIFALCESTEDAPEVEAKNEHETGFDRGRRFEAKHIRRGIGTWFQDEFCGRSFLGEPAPAKADPCLALWRAMNEAEKVGNRSDDKLIVEFLRRAGYVIAAAPQAAQPERYRFALDALVAVGFVEQSKVDEALRLADSMSSAAQPEQAQQSGQIEAAPIDEYPKTDQAFFAFWYSHMKGDHMQPPLHEVSHASARYIWDAGIASILARLEVVPEPRKWNLYGTKHHWVRAGDFDDYRAAMLAAAKGETK